MELDDIKDAQLHLLANPQPCVLPVTLPPALLDEILADADISMRLEFSDAGHKLVANGQEFPVTLAVDPQPKDVFVSEPGNIHSWHQVGTVSQKLLLPRELEDEDRDRIRTIGKEAELKRKGHKSQKLEAAPSKSEQKGMKITVTRPPKRSKPAATTTPTAIATAIAIAAHLPPPPKQPKAASPPLPAVSNHSNAPAPPVSLAPAPRLVPMPPKLRGEALRAKLLQVLALGDLDEFTIRKQTRGETADTAALLAKVATYQPGIGTYRLLDSLYAEVDPASYTKPEDRENFSKRAAQFGKITKVETKPTHINGSPKQASMQPAPPKPAPAPAAIPSPTATSSKAADTKTESASSSSSIASTASSSSSSAADKPSPEKPAEKTVKPTTTEKVGKPPATSAMDKPTSVKPPITAEKPLAEKSAKPTSTEKAATPATAPLEKVDKPLETPTQKNAKPSLTQKPASSLPVEKTAKPSVDKPATIPVEKPPPVVRVAAALPVPPLLDLSPDFLNPITSSAQAQQYQAEFDDKYAVYLRLHAQLKEQTAIFTPLAMEWEKSLDPSSKKDLAKKIDSEYDARYAQVSALKNNLSRVELFLASLKSRLKDWNSKHANGV